jgi:hypothetical protein
MILYQFNKLMRIELVSYILDLKGAPTKWERLLFDLN